MRSASPHAEREVGPAATRGHPRVGERCDEDRCEDRENRFNPICKEERR